MFWIRDTLTASAGTNNIVITLPAGKKLKVVNVINETSPWLPVSIEIIDINDDKDTADKTIALVHKVVQQNDKDIHWEGDYELHEPYTRIRAQFLLCNASDELILTVGYD